MISYQRSRWWSGGLNKILFFVSNKIFLYRPMWGYMNQTWLGVTRGVILKKLLLWKKTSTAARWTTLHRLYSDMSTAAWTQSVCIQRNGNTCQYLFSRNIAGLKNFRYHPWKWINDATIEFDTQFRTEWVQDGSKWQISAWVGPCLICN